MARGMNPASQHSAGADRRSFSRREQTARYRAPCFSVVHIDASTGILLNRLRPHLQIRKPHAISAIPFESELDALAYAKATSDHYSHVACIVLNAGKNPLYETPEREGTWFEHPVPLEFSRRIERIFEERRSKPWYPLLHACDLVLGWLDSGVPRRSNDDAVHAKHGS
ncbi:hypothetical protein CA85_46050 [Allorhodopirellula solitaria]|uniref:Uncharacterized protein n=1 Tax=Allorhodopirellula solitaria TaxID=2527987 RepID=A0A5C5WYH5_9BACT|nr:hypothetical protein CA85_46050 [Allorhodopirellula solitaria]